MSMPQEGAAGSVPVEGAPPVGHTPIVSDQPASEPEPESEPIAGIEALPESWQTEIRNLRRENAERRTKLQEFEQAFQGYEPDQVSYVQQVIQAMVSPNESARQAAADELEHWASQLKGNPVTNPDEPAASAPTAPAPAPAAPDPADILKQVAAMLDQRDEKATIKRMADEMISKAAGLGYTPGSVEYIQLMTIAQQMGNDVQAAHVKMEEAIAARVQAAIEEANKKGERFPSQDQQRQHPTPPTDDGVKDWIGDTNKTTEAARRWLEAHRRA